MDSNTVLKERHINKTIWFDPKALIADSNWVPGDYVPSILLCSCGEYPYHLCGPSNPEKFEIVLDSARDDYFYPDLYNQIRNQGFRVPIGAIVGKRYEHIALVDGHHRLAVAIDLDIPIPIWVSKPNVSLFDLVAFDTQHWQPGKIDTPFEWVA